MTAFKSIMQGLAEAQQYAEGKPVNAKIHQLEIPSVDVVAIRTKTGLSQNDFAKSIGVAKGTLLNWEQGRRAPSGPAGILLAMLDKKPSIVRELLG